MPEKGGRSRCRILAADDDKMNLIILEDYLKPLGCEVLKAVNGKEALDEIEFGRPDLVFLDIIMPEMDGHEVCRRVKENPELRDIPIVMVTSLEGKDELVKALEYGADDFLNKPLNGVEIKARARSLLKKKALNDQLRNAYMHINDLTSFAEGELTALTSSASRKEIVHGNLITRLLRIEREDGDRPSHMLLGKRVNSEGLVAGELYGFEDRLGRVRVSFNLNWEHLLGQDRPLRQKGVLSYVGPARDGKDYVHIFGDVVAKHTGSLRNFILCESEERGDVVAAFNYGRVISGNDADILKNFLLVSYVFTAISEQMEEVDKSFRYLVTSLARAAEANDEETGNHIVRVNEYAAMIAEDMGRSETFIRDIGFFAQMHDVGKIHIHFSLLRKPGELTPEESRMIRDHTVYGAMILGEEPRLRMARDIALCHHERYDGGGYPKGLKGESIPVSARIVAMADIYDALRSKRSYKPSFSHQKTFEIITTGDHKTRPAHFDPKVMEAFIRREKEFDKIYNRLKDDDGEKS